jgi:hypothetical protein
MRIVLDWRPYCLNGWGPGGCIYTGGHYCDRLAGHAGRCRCVCGATTTRRPLGDNEKP